VFVVLIVLFLFSYFSVAQKSQPECSEAKCKQDETSQPASQNKNPIHKEDVVVTGTFEPTPLEEVERAVSAINLREMP
jgi:hypothetical protein